MITLYDSAFSPFARKVRMVIDHKGLKAKYVDGLRRENHERLKEINQRAEVPAIVDGDLTIINSADIIAYLDYKFPDHPVLPFDPEIRAKARAWERTADHTIDPILVNISYWLWAERPDSMPTGLKDAAKRDMGQVYAELEQNLSEDGFLFSEVSIAEYALIPHLASTFALGVGPNRTAFPKVCAWIKRLKKLDVIQADMTRTREWFRDIANQDVERNQIFWRGDRIEWILAKGHHDWFFREIEEDRVLWPGLGLPTR